MSCWPAIHEVPAEEVLVLPNSSNVIMAAARACELSEKPARVVPRHLAAGGASWSWSSSTRRRLRGERRATRGGAGRHRQRRRRRGSRDDAQGRFRQGDAVGFADGEIVAWAARLDSGGDDLEPRRRAIRHRRRREAPIPPRPRSSPRPGPGRDRGPRGAGGRTRRRWSPSRSSCSLLRQQLQPRPGASCAPADPLGPGRLAPRGAFDLALGVGPKAGRRRCRGRNRDRRRPALASPRPPGSHGGRGR